MSANQIKPSLTLKQEKFCQEYVATGNAAGAAKAAGYSAKTAESIGCENLTKPKLQARIAELQCGMEDRARLKQDDIVRMLEDALLVDPFDWLEVKEDGTLGPIAGKEMPKWARVLVSKIYQTAHGLRIELFSKEKAMELLMRKYGMLTDNVEAPNLTAALEGWLERVRARTALPISNN